MRSGHPQAVGSRAIVFVDGQNLFRAAKDAFGYHYPNYDIKKLADTICSSRGWIAVENRFYTGVPDRKDDPLWHDFWSAKLAHMGRSMTVVYKRPLRYSDETIPLPDGTKKIVRRPREKGIDIRLALDMVRAALEERGNVFVVFSQDQDLTEAVDEVKMISRRNNSNIVIASAYPVGGLYTNTRGIDRTDWIQIDKATYDACIDPTDYRPRRGDLLPFTA